MAFSRALTKFVLAAAALCAADAAQLRSQHHHGHHHAHREAPAQDDSEAAAVTLNASAAASASPLLVAVVPDGASTPPAAPVAAVVQDGQAATEDAAAGPAPAPAAPQAPIGVPAPAPAAAPAAPAAAPAAPEQPVAVVPGMQPAAQAIAQTDATLQAAPTTAQPNQTVEELVYSIDKMVEAEKEVINPQDPVSMLKEELAAVEWLQDELSEKEDSMKEEVYRAKIVTAEQALAKETGSPGTAAMLADMRLQMHALAAPFYTKVLKEEMAGLQARKKELVNQIETAEGKTAEEEIEEDSEKAEKPEPEKKSSSGIDWTIVLLVILVSLFGAAFLFAYFARRQAPPRGR
eukprot:TRINITY_DN8093_c0_g1_i1.p1 TRINITY_DN8093_c0_g1~~TRINITY_DN8093_c0_g1_i1.p1  ORF type:complete len:348 (+),score=142.58 TRINITY_DN8093_c0_g1_i1:221-1264(+)